MDAGKPAEGLPLLLAAKAGRPGDDAIRFMLANTLAVLGRREEAVVEYKGLLDINPKHAEAANRLGGTLMNLGRPAEAQPWFEKALALVPKDPTYTYNLGNSYSSQGRLHDALAWFDKTLALDPKYAEAMCNKGHSLRKLGRFAEAVEWLRKGDAEGRKRKTWPYKSEEWVEWAERLAAVEKRLPALIAGVPAPWRDRMVAADVCQIRGDHVGRARLIQFSYAEGHRWVAPSVAAQAALNAAGTAGLPPETAARWRGQAHAWLRAEVRHLTPKARGGDKEARDGLRQIADNRAFDAVKSGAAFDALPGHERQAWSRLWLALRLALAEDALHLAAGGL
jgi:hypothetical protein